MIYKDIVLFFILLVLLLIMYLIQDYKRGLANISAILSRISRGLRGLVRWVNKQ